MSIDVRPVENLDEFQDAFMAIGQYFGMEPNRERMERFSELLPLDRMFSAHDNGSIVGGAGGFPFQMSVPGGTIACTGTTIVGVSPTHRRRGILRQMMRAHIDDAHERGDPIAALWASEETIYGRFGYGAASTAGEVLVPRERTGFAVPHERRGTIRLVERDEAAKLFPPIWESLMRARPGVPSRSAKWWEHRTLNDPAERRDGAGPKRFALVELDGETAGYAIYRHKWGFADGMPDSKVVVVEAFGSSMQATADLWRYLLDVDWVAWIEAHLLPPDHPLFFLLARKRSAKYRPQDGLWVRLLDVGKALSGRTYAADDAIVFDVHDEFCPWNEGRWRLEGGSAERTDAEADIALKADTLGATYLGGVDFASLAQVGLVEELKDGAIARADGMFRHGLHPWCPEIF
jgi:predicted acetyltransferase